MRQERQAAVHPLLGSYEAAVIRRVSNRRINPGHVVELRKWPDDLGVSRRHPVRCDLIQAEVVRSEVMTHVSDVPDFHN